MMSKKWKIKLTHWFLSQYVKIQGDVAEKSSLSPHTEFNSIIIYSTTALGDFMFNTPAIRAVRQRYPDACITLISSRKNKDLVEQYACINHVIYWDNKIKNIIPVLLKLRKKKPELAIILHAHFPYAIMSAVMAGCQYILHANYKTDPLMMDRWIISNASTDPAHLIQSKMNLLTPLGITSDNTTLYLPDSYNKVSKPAGHILIGFQMGASSLERCWPISFFSALATRLLSSHDHVDIVLIGSQAEKKLAHDLLCTLDKSARRRVKDHVGKTTLTELLKIIHTLDLMVTGDTGPLHLAIALQVRTVSLFSSSHPCYTGPYQDFHLHKILYLPDNKAIYSTHYPGQPLAIITPNKVYTSILETQILSTPAQEPVLATQNQ